MKACQICQRVNDPFAVTCVACGEGSWVETHVAIAPSAPPVVEPVVAAAPEAPALPADETTVPEVVEPLVPRRSRR